MARADLIVTLVRAASTGDQKMLRSTVEAMAAEERAKQHHLLADRLIEQLNANGPATDRRLLQRADHTPLMVTELTPQISIDDLILATWVRQAVNGLVEEQIRREVLRSYGLEPRHRILLVGPPGNGKTSLAEALADMLMLPFLVVRYEGIIGSYLGETANRLKALFDFVRSRHCVLFFDEFDVIGKERGDVHETGEIKRVVNSLLLQIDDLPSHVVVVTASNHPELLDRAIWRRFQLRLHLQAPKQDEIEIWLARYESRVGSTLGLPRDVLASELHGLTFSELDDFGADVFRRYILGLPSADIGKITRRQLEHLRRQYKPPTLS